MADLLRGDYKQSDYGKVILPFTVLRRLDCVLEPSKEAVLAEKELREGQGLDPEPFLLRVAEQAFCNTSALGMKRLMGDQDNIGENLRNTIQAFTPAVRDTGVDGRGVVTPEGFVVLAGSVGRLENVPSIQGTNDARVRKRLIAAEVMEVSAAGTITVPRDHLFRSPSSAASALLGRTANGWREWKNAQGLSLSQVKRGPQATRPPRCAPSTSAMCLRRWPHG